MATIRCACGEHVHYSVENVGFNARCRCGRTVALPKIAAVPPPKTPKQLAREDKRSARIRMQVLAAGLFLILTIGVVLAVALLNQPGSTFRQQPRPAVDAAP